MSKTADHHKATAGMNLPSKNARGLSPRVREMVEGLHELCDAVETGAPLEQTATVRTDQIDLVPPELPPPRDPLSGIRWELSQALFAAFLGVGLPTVRSWEQGQREPSTLRARFLGEIRDNPRYWREKLARAAVRKVTAKDRS